MFLLIPVVYVIVFKYIPMGGVVIAFKDFKLRQGIWGSDWVGFEHFIRFFSTYQCRKVIKNTLIISFYSLIAGFPIPIIFALMMNCVSNEKIKKTVQSIVCLPHFISTVVMVGIIFQLTMEKKPGLIHFLCTIFLKNNSNTQPPTEPNMNIKVK